MMNLSQEGGIGIANDGGINSHRFAKDGESLCLDQNAT